MADSDSQQCRRIYSNWSVDWSLSRADCSAQGRTVSRVEHSIENQTWRMGRSISDRADSTSRSFHFSSFYSSTVQFGEFEEQHCHSANNYTDSAWTVACNYTCLFAITNAAEWSLLCCRLWLLQFWYVITNISKENVNYCRMGKKRFLCEWSVSSDSERSWFATCRSNNMPDSVESYSTRSKFCSGYTEFYVCRRWSWKGWVGGECLS